MSPVFVTYIGFVVAALILLWGLFVVGKQYFVRRRKVDSRLLNAWVPLKPTPNAESPEDSIPDIDEDDQEEGSRADLQTRSQQNGHYSESKKLL
jgi:uncharacterized membrane protein